MKSDYVNYARNYSWYIGKSFLFSDPRKEKYFFTINSFRTAKALPAFSIGFRLIGKKFPNEK